MTDPVTIPLNGSAIHGSGWTLRPIDNLTHVPAPIMRAGPIPASVPGCVHTDLIAAGLLADPNHDRHEADQFFVGETGWEYQTTLDITPDLLAHDRVDLVFDGLDTIATVSVNGEEVGRSSNMHTAARFDAKPALKAGENTLTVRFDSPNRAAREMQERLGTLPHVYPEQQPWNFIRKEACNFGWDWGPVCPTSGVWRPARVHAWSGARIASVRPLIARADEQLAVVRAHVELERLADWQGAAAFGLLDPDGEPVAESTASADAAASADADSISAELRVPNPRRWWPRAHGDQPLYTLRVTLQDDEGRTIETATRRLGLRTVELDTSPDEIGSKFDLLINGERVFCTGANWIPDDLFPSRLTPDRYRTRVQAAADCGMNMLRVWGGGIYEDEAFYNACDELGVLVWQDFLFACALYPEDEPIWSSVEQEARDNLARLSHHPSLVLWCGSNENIWGYQTWGWKERVKELARDGEAERPWGNGYYNDLLPRVCADLDPSRPYWPSSPWSGDMDTDAADPDHGNRHTWEGWGPDYRNHIPRFLAEFGHQAPANHASLARVTPAPELRVGSDSMIHRQRAVDGNEGRLDKPLAQWFTPTTDFDTWHYQCQVLQARSVTTAIEWLRAHNNRCSGVLFWQFNDTWVGHTWSCLDHDGRKKPLWYATRRSNTPRLLTIQPDGPDQGSPLGVYAVNETDEHWRETAQVGTALLSDRAAPSADVGFVVPPRGVVRIADLATVFHVEHNARSCARYWWARTASDPTPNTPNTPNTPALWFDGVDKDTPYPEPEFDVEIEQTAPGVLTLVVRARTLVRDLLLQPDRLDPGAVCSENLITLLPGDERRIEITHSASLDPASLTARPVLMSVNDSGKR
ncbi:MAG: beta-mannosidase [Phycisphaerales bacterium]|jgi:beta-mannosidase